MFEGHLAWLLAEHVQKLSLVASICRTWLGLGAPFWDLLQHRGGSGRGVSMVGQVKDGSRPVRAKAARGRRGPKAKKRWKMAPSGESPSSGWASMHARPTVSARCDITFGRIPKGCRNGERVMVGMFPHTAQRLVPYIRKCGWSTAVVGQITRHVCSKIQISESLPFTTIKCRWPFVLPKLFFSTVTVVAALLSASWPTFS